MSKFQEKSTGLLTNVDLKSTKGKLLYWIFFAILIFCCLITFLPAVWTVFTALKDPNEIYTSTKFFPEKLSLNIFVTRVSDSWNQLKLGRSIINTLYFSVIAWAIKLTVCMFAGYTYWPLWLGGAVDAFAVMLFKNAFDAVSNSIIESATLDGAGKLKIFFSIMIPLSGPIIIYESIMTLSGAWSNFFGPYLIIQDTKKQLLPAKIFLMSNDGTVKQNTYLMGLIIASMPQLLIFAFFKKHIMGGINIGGVKG